MFVKPVAKAATIVTGRKFRIWWRALPEHQREVWKHRLSLSKNRIAIIVGVLTAAGIVNYITHVHEAPITKRKRYIGFTPEQFIDIAELEYDRQMEASKGHVLRGDHPYCNRVMRVAQKIVAKNQDLDFMRNQKWTVIVVDSSEQNAFILPTGHIFVYTGLLNIVQNDDQLAMVLAHEMAHALLNHAAEQVSVAQLLDVMIIFVMAAIWAFMPSDGFAVLGQWFYNKVVQLLLHLPYSRKLEIEADEVGLHLAAKACFDVRESSTFWSLMSLLTEVPGSDQPPPEWLSTHPTHENRASKLDDMIPAAIHLRQSCQCPTLSTTDPRQQTQFLKNIIRDNDKSPQNIRSARMIPAPAS
ncbi:Metalloendopeptidase OMA1, mitochondrial [Lamellibrachia satsuma]|nr:Metalloendopeptidase OMA1, mitochondrial [Lamellibrachia satsuma]